MRSNLVRITPAARTTRKFSAVGNVVICKAGGFYTHRIHFEPPTAEAHRDEQSEPLVTGRAYVAPQGKFTEFWISFEALPFAPEEVVLQVLDDASIVVPIGRQPNGFEIHTVAQTVTTVNTGTTVQIYSDTTWLSGDSAINDQARRLIMPRGFIGGGVASTVSYTLNIMARLGFGPASTLAQYAQFLVASADINALFSVSFELGARQPYQGAPANTNNGSAPLPWPTCGLAIYVTNASGFNADFELQLFEKVPL